MMHYRYLQTERTGAVLTCRLSNPPSHTLNNAGVAELGALLASLQQDRELRVLVLTGAEPGVFIAHYELKDVQAMAAEAERGSRDDTLPLHAYHQCLNALEQLPLVTVAAMNGNSAGGGLELALCCDFRLMMDGPYVTGLPETNNGIIPGAGGTQRLTRVLGEARAMEMILLGRLLTPGQALAWGLIHEVYQAQDFEREISAFADKLAQRAPIALREAKQLVRGAGRWELQQGLSREQQAFYRCMLSEDANGAIKAWLRGERYTFRGQ